MEGIGPTASADDNNSGRHNEGLRKVCTARMMGVEGEDVEEENGVGESVDVKEERMPRFRVWGKFAEGGSAR